jgi:hypothetical protein
MRIRARRPRLGVTCRHPAEPFGEGPWRWSLWGAQRLFEVVPKRFITYPMGYILAGLN